MATSKTTDSRAKKQTIQSAIETAAKKTAAATSSGVNAYSSAADVEKYLGIGSSGSKTGTSTGGINANSSAAEVEKYLGVTSTPTAQKTAVNTTNATDSGSGSGSGSGTTATAARTGADIPMTSVYDPTTDAAYQSAKAALEAAQQNAPTYAGTYDGLISDLYDQIINREKFSYDVNEDPLYAQYRDLYTRNGQTAMQDTMGQAAALTGGYNSTYAQNAGQQAYNSYMQALNDAVPELYAQARSDYDAEGNAMLTQYGLLQDQRDTEYGRYQDSMTNWQNELSRAMEAEQLAYNRGLTATEGENAAREANYEKLASMIEIGYTPSDSELKAAGMSRDQYNAIKAYQAAAAASSGSGSGSSSSSGKTKFTADQVSEAGLVYKNKGETALYTYLAGLEMQGYSEDALEALGNYALSNFTYNANSKETKKHKSV